MGWPNPHQGWVQPFLFFQIFFSGSSIFPGAGKALDPHNRVLNAIIGGWQGQTIKRACRS